MYNKQIHFSAAAACTINIDERNGIKYTRMAGEQISSDD